MATPRMTPRENLARNKVSSRPDTVFTLVRPIEPFFAKALLVSRGALSAAALEPALYALSAPERLAQALLECTTGTYPILGYSH